MVGDLQRILWGKDSVLCFDAVSEKGIVLNLSLVLARNGKQSLVLAYLRDDISDHIEQSTTMVGSLVRNLAAGKVRGPVREGKQGLGGLSGGLECVENVLKALGAGKASAVKHVVRIASDPEA